MIVNHCDSCGERLYANEKLFSVRIFPTSKDDPGTAIGAPVHQMDCVCKLCVLGIQALQSRDLRR